MIELHTKKKQSRKTTSGKFEDYMTEMRRLGRLILPAERDLCQLLNCSRSNLRIVLKEYEQCGDIVKKNRSRVLSMEKATGEKIIGSFLFVAHGENMVLNPCWNKLWTRFQPMAQAANIASQLYLIGNVYNEEKVLRHIVAGPEVVVLTDTSNLVLSWKIARLTGKKVIVLDEQFHISGVNSLITVDNYSIGFNAARELAAHGYKRPAWIGNNVLVDGQIYKMYVQRLNGFRAGCREMNLEFDAAAEFSTAGNRVRSLIRLINLAETFKNGQYDSVFVYSDDDVEYFYQSLQEKGIRVPDDLGVITVNSYDRAISNDPPITCISHGTYSVVTMLVKVLTVFFTQKSWDIGKFFLDPSIHSEKTL